MMAETCFRRIKRRYAALCGFSAFFLLLIFSNFSSIFLTNYFDNKKIYEINSVQFQPVIQICDSPKVTNIKCCFVDSFSSIGAHPNYPDIGVCLKLKITNKKDPKANIWFYTNRENYSYFSVNELINDICKQIDTTTVYSELPQKYSQISDKDTLLITDEFGVQFVIKDTITFHWIIVYSNELDHLYYTVYWSKFKIGQILAKHFPHDTCVIKSLDLIEQSQDFGMFSESQTNRLRGKYIRYCNKLKSQKDSLCLRKAHDPTEWLNDTSLNKYRR